MPNNPKPTRIHATHHRTAQEAIRARDAEGWETVIFIPGCYLATTRAEAARLATAGMEVVVLQGMCTPEDERQAAPATDTPDQGEQTDGQ